MTKQDETGGPLPAEKIILSQIGSGRRCSLGSAVPGPDEYEKCRVRAGFLQAFILNQFDIKPGTAGVSIAGAYIAEELDLDACNITVPLRLTSCLISGMSVLDTHLKTLTLTGSHLGYFYGDRSEIDGTVFLNSGFSAGGEVRLLGAKIGGDLNCINGKFLANGPRALSCDGALVSGAVFLAGGFESRSPVNLSGVVVQKHIDCSGGVFGTHSSTYGLTLDSAKIEGSVSLVDGFVANSGVSAIRARIGGSVACAGGTFGTGEGGSLVLSAATIGGSVMMNRRTKTSAFSSTGTVRLDDAIISGNVSLVGGEFKNGSAFCLTAERSSIRGALHMDATTVCEGPIDLAAASVGSLADAQSAWPDHNILNGFKYAELAGLAPTDPTTRIAWLHKQAKEDLGEPSTINPGAKPDFREQPWEQCAQVLRTMGYRRKAEDVLIAKEEQLREIGQVSWPFFHWLWGKALGYGYRPLRLLVAVPILWLLFAPLYMLAA